MLENMGIDCADEAESDDVQLMTNEQWLVR